MAGSNMVGSNSVRFASALGHWWVTGLLVVASGCSAMGHAGQGQGAHGQHGEASVAEAAAMEHSEAHMEHSEEHTDHGQDAAGEPSAAEHGHDHAGHDHADHDHAGHDHAPLVVPADQPAPALTLLVTPDPVSGWNLELETTNFEFAPERVNGESTFNEGHAHLLVNGEKRGRIYSNWHHLTGLMPGENTIRVTLNGNGHESLVVEGEVVADEVVVTVP